MRTAGLLALLGLAACGSGAPPRMAVRWTYEVLDPAAAAEVGKVMQRRLDALHVRGRARAAGDRVVVELPALDEQTVERTRMVLVRSGRLELHVVDNGTGEMARLAGRVDQDPAAQDAGIKFEPDVWRDQSGKTYEDHYLLANDRETQVAIEEARKIGCFHQDVTVSSGTVSCLVTGQRVIERYLASLPPDAIDRDAHEIAYEQITPPPERGDRRPFWRTYYLWRDNALDARAITGARAARESPSDRAVVWVTLDDAGGRRFAELTGQNIGHKIAITLDDRVAAAPIVGGAITGGKFAVTMGEPDPARAYRDAQELAIVLASGALPVPVMLDSVEKL